MINIDELNKTWSTIIKNQDRNNDNQTINFITAIQHGKAIVSEVTPSELLQMDIEDVKKISIINELFDMISDAQEKSFGDIVKKALKKD
ncbi:MAG: hypothetical protein MJ160_05935 [Treponema sp.]|nr:hypothetical protein [Treponema sp.]